MCDSVSKKNHFIWENWYTIKKMISAKIVNYNLLGKNIIILIPMFSEIISMDETRLEKISLMQSDAQMFCRRNVRRLDLVSKLTTEKPTYLQRGKRKLLKSMETSNNSLTVPASMTTASAASAASTGIKSKKAGP